ncbi:hypothetical protein [Pseudooceanicola nitratireducens]|uniref:hypothetical protein n=1 Tax=Pseudooceanicola nitratireducens TaxID=517719 RepID=UPI001C960235|nr:hypothetical protein [Pseudooceanicola nitratireducens]MBY6159218.1 hypothetical protein [Pseudooceanicola nitratireducens]
MVSGIQNALLIVGSRRMRVDYKVTREGGAIIAGTDALYEFALDGDGRLLLTHDRAISIKFDAYQVGEPFLRFTLA